MAMEVAGLLDEIGPNSEWAGKCCTALNQSLGKVTVGKDYNVVVSIANRSYQFLSDAKGVLCVRILPKGYNKAGREGKGVQCQVMIAGSVLSANKFEVKANKFEVNDGVTQMINRRQLQFSGDTDKLVQLSDELSPHVSLLRDVVEAAGPGIELIEDAIEVHNSRVGQNSGAYDVLMPVHEYSDLELPAIMHFGGWVHYGATSNANGNPGQSNYCAANCLLDNFTYAQRTVTHLAGFQAITMHWGAVGGIGMRWKAFASQDMLGQDTGGEMSMLQTVADAQACIRDIMKLWVEQSASQKLMKYDPNMSDLDARCMLMGYPNNRKDRVWGKGKGGGITMDDDVAAVTFHNMPISSKNVDADDSWILPGKRIRVHGLTSQTDMNGQKGTLVEEVRHGVWHVRLDNDNGNKLLKTKHMMQVQSSAANKAKVELEDNKPVQEPMSLAGNWNDWYPQDMEYDAHEKCYIVDANVSCADGRFGIGRGVAGQKPWKAALDTAHRFGNKVEGRYRIKVFVKGCKVSEVSWSALV